MPSSRLAIPTLVLTLGACATAPPIPAEAVAHNTAGAALLRAGSLDAAEARFRLAVEYHSRFAEPYANLGLLAFARGDAQLAEQHLRDALELDEDFAVAWSDLGVVREARGDPLGARRAYEKALSLDPGLTAARRNLSLLLARRGLFVHARAHLMRLLELTPEDHAMGALLAYGELRLGRPRAASRRAERILRVAPGEPAARLVRGMLRARRGDYRGALADLSAATAHPVLGHAARVRQAAVLLLTGERARAARICRRLLSERPRDAAVRLLSARLALERGEPRLARLHAEVALESHPGLPEALRLRAVACARGAACDGGPGP